MTMSGYRDETNSHVIIKVLADFLGEDINVLIWQQHGQKRIIRRATVENINLERNCIFFQFEPGQNNPVFDSERMIYITNAANTIAFNCSVLMVDQQQLVTKYPSKLIMPEKRSEPRFNFDIESNQTIFLSYGNTREKRDGHYLLRNISHGGACLQIPKKLSPFFYEDESLRVRWRHDDEILKISGKVAHLTNVLDTFYLGISFNQPVPQSQLNSLITQ